MVSYTFVCAFKAHEMKTLGTFRNDNVVHSRLIHSWTSVHYIFLSLNTAGECGIHITMWISENTIHICNIYFFLGKLINDSWNTRFISKLCALPKQFCLFAMPCGVGRFRHINGRMCPREKRHYVEGINELPFKLSNKSLGKQLD